MALKLARMIADNPQMRFIIFFILISLPIHSSFSQDRAPSFKACAQAGREHCSHIQAKSFEELKEILGVAKVLDFQKRLKDKVKVSLEVKIYEAELLEACATADSSWFRRRGFAEQQRAAACGERVEQIQSSIKERYPLMRRELALASSNLRESRILNDKSTWIKTRISHGSLSGLGELSPLSQRESEGAIRELGTELSRELLRVEKLNPSSFQMKISNRNASLGEITAKEKKSDDKRSDELILAQFLISSTESYAISNMRGFLDQNQARHKEKYFQILNQMPLLAFIPEFQIEDQGRPSRADVGEALRKTRGKLTKFYDDLNKKETQGKTDWALYAQFNTEIESLLKDFPEYCPFAETLLKEKKSAEDKQLYADLALAGLAAVPCFMTGPVVTAVCIGSGIGVGVKGVTDAVTATNQSLGKNLTDFLGREGEANFLKYDQERKNLILQSLFLPLGAFGTTRSTGSAVARSYHAYDDAGRFITKSEGLEYANKALLKLLEHKNFDSLSPAERAKLFDQLLAQEILPSHLLSFLENKKGGFKLIDTNYDFDSFPPALLEKLAAKLGSKDEATKLIKSLYHRHVLDHHGSMGHVENATQQVISEFEKKSGAFLELEKSNPIKYRLELEKAARQLRRDYFRVSTDNLGDGQLATYLVRHHAEDLITKPQFAQFMRRVANIEDFEAFGPGLYQKFQKLKAKKTGTLSPAEKEELDAISVALARQKAINDTLLKFGTNQNLPDAKIALLYADRFNGLGADIQKKIISEVDNLTSKILKDQNFRDEMASGHVDKVMLLSGSPQNPGLVRLSEVSGPSRYSDIPPEKVARAKEEIFAFNATKLRQMYEESTGKKLGPFDVFHAPQPVLNEKKKILVSISEANDKRTFVVAFGNGLRDQTDTLKTMAREIHLVEKRTLEKLIQTSKDPQKVSAFKTELEGINKALSAPTIEAFGGPASLMRSAADNKEVKDLVFNFNGVRSSPEDLMEAVIRARAR